MINSKGLLKQNYRFHILVLTIILFSSSALYSENNKDYYKYIVLAISGLSYIYVLIHPGLIKLLIKSKYTLWVFSIFSYYMFYGLVLKSYKEFNWDYTFFVMIVILNVIVWFVGISVKDSVDILIKSATIASILLCLFILYNEGSLIFTGAARIGDSASGNVNTVGLYLGIFSILCLYKVLFENKKLYFVIYIIQAIFMLLTGSKKTLVYLILGFGILYMLKVKLKVYKYIVPLIFTLLLLYFIFTNPTLYNIIGYRLIDFLGQIGLNVENAQYSYSTDIRKEMIKIGWLAFLRRPLFGNGWFYFSVYSGLGTYSHNNYIEILVTYGLAGFIFYYGIFISTFIKLCKCLQNNYSKLFFTLILTILVSDFASISFYDSPRNYIILFFAHTVADKIIYKNTNSKTAELRR